MRARRLAPLLLSLACALLAAPQPAPTADGTSLQELEAVLVVGERPGPALWKVTNRKGHALWILPTYGPLPDGLVLRSTQLETVISQSQQVHFLTQVNAPLYARSDERARTAFLNTDSKLLYDLMSPDMYAQFQDLNNRYGGSNLALQMYRPIAAVDRLKQAAMQSLRLTSDRTISAAVYELAMKHGVPTFGVKMKRDEVWDEMIERIGNTPRVLDIACAKERMDRLEKDLQDSVARANAWAKGDIATLREDPGLRESQVDGKVCAAYFKDIKVGVIQDRALHRYRYSASRKWLKDNQSTLVLVPIADLFEKDGLLRRLKRDGYKVEEPATLSDAGQKK